MHLSRWMIAILLLGPMVNPTAGFARDGGHIKIVEMCVGVRVLDGNGQPLHPPTGVRLEVSRFGQTTWAPGRWAYIIGRLDSEGNMLVMAKFPVDSMFLTGLIRRAGKQDQADLGISLRILDGDGRPLRPANGIRLEIYRFGKYPWPPGRVAIVTGRPDEGGYLRTPIRLPIASVTLRNFILLANGQGI
ncbi:MAG: hypothetical protein AAB619_03425 [Patescibacteria group bacterium]